MKKLTLHRETLRMVTSEPTARNPFERGIVFGRAAMRSSPNLCQPEPLTYICETGTTTL